MDAFSRSQNCDNDDIDILCSTPKKLKNTTFTFADESTISIHSVKYDDSSNKELSTAVMFPSYDNITTSSNCFDFSVSIPNDIPSVLINSNQTNYNHEGEESDNSVNNLHVTSAQTAGVNTKNDDNNDIEKMQGKIFLKLH